MFFRNTFAGHTPYALFLYLLLTSEKDIKRTLYFVGETVPYDVSRNLKHAHRIKYDQWENIIKFRIKALFLWRWKIAFTKLFIAQDHMDYMPALIGFQNYTLLEDAPEWYLRLDRLGIPSMVRQRGLKPRIKNSVRYGPVFGYEYGRNNQCKCRIYTFSEDSKSTWLSDGRGNFLDINKMWAESSSDKKELIKNIFNIDDKLIGDLKSIKIILVADGITEHEGGVITEAEMINIYKPYVEKFASGRIIIKPHPANKIDYKLYFPDAVIVPDYIPMQLLILLGMKPEIAITIESSAVSTLPSDTTLLWLGHESHPRLLERSGAYPCPYDFKLIDPKI